MGFDYVLGSIIAVAVLLYLLYVLINAEKF
jgi:K+-transporting ATPase KdpF subunit